MKKINLFFAAIFIAALVRSQTVSTFDNLTLGPDTFWNGSDLSGGFTSGQAFFLNSYDTAYGGLWSGFAYSDETDSTTPGYANQYSAITAGGYGGSANYAVSYVSGTSNVNLIGNGLGSVVGGFYVTNSTYTYLSMLNGTQFSKKFGGPTGNDPDWFTLTVTGMYQGQPIPDSVTFYLADYRFTDNDSDYLVRDWEWVDLHALGNVDSLQFFMASSDTGAYGINTPTYFCMDNFTVSDSAYLKPVANNVYVTINYEQDTFINVLPSDYDPSGNPIYINLIAGPFIPGASAYDSATGIVYYPSTGIVSTDILVYTACDQDGQCDTAIVFININALPSGISDVNMQGIIAAPNPFTSALWIQHPADVEKITLYDMQGRVVQNITCDGSGKTEVNGAELPAGTYFARLLSSDASAVIKLIRQ